MFVEVKLWGGIELYPHVNSFHKLLRLNTFIVGKNFGAKINGCKRLKFCAQYFLMLNNQFTTCSFPNIGVPELFSCK